MRWGFSLLILVSTYLTWSVNGHHDERLFTSSITYCAPPDVLIVQEFDVTYFKINNSVAFSLSATNLASNLNATANLILNAYGMTPVNYTFNLCDVLQGQLCPLPEYNVTGSADLPIPTAIQLPIPEIAFKIPDLEAVAQLTLSRVEDGVVAVCIQSTLSNGWSLHIPAVSAATATFALLSFLTSFFNSFRSPASSPAVFRTITTFNYFQYIAMTGMLHLNYPSTYIAFATNFGWSFGLFNKPNSFIQNAIERMRAKTGSDLSGDSQAPSSYADRTLSPYNLYAIQDDDNPKTIDIGSFVGGSSSQSASPPQSSVAPATITSTSETLNPGIPVYVNQMDVATGNAFMTLFMTLLFFILASTVFVGAMIVVLRAFRKYRRSPWAIGALGKIRPVLLSNGLRLVQIFILPVMILAFFQWSLHDNWLSTLFSVFTFLLFLAGFSYPAYLILRVVFTHGSAELEEPAHQSILGALVGPYRARRYFFFMSAIIVPFIRACFISFVKENGFIQVVGLVVLEVLYLCALLVLRPGHTRRSDILEVFLGFVRVITTAALLPFVREKLAVTAIPRVAVGIGIAVVMCVGIMVIAINILLDLLPWKIMWWRIRGQKKGETDSSDQSEKDLEKDESKLPQGSENHQHGIMVASSSSSPGKADYLSSPESKITSSP